MIDLGAQSYYTVLGVSPDASQMEIGEALDRIGRDLDEAILRTQDKNEKERLEARHKEINAIGGVLSAPKKREDYNRANAHLKFFMVQSGAIAPFVDRAARLEWIHGAVRRYLAGCGVELQPLSDLEAIDFSADYSPNELLDSIMELD
jgi:curved DNA-binding protein CbpA